MKSIVKYLVSLAICTSIAFAQADSLYVYSGTGFAISPSKLATAAHLAEKSKALIVVCPNFTEKSKLIYLNNDKDLAIVQIKNNRFKHPIPVSRTVESRIVISIGFGNGADGTTDISVGDYLFSTPTFHVLSSKLIHGMSGGPTFDHYGNVIGINSRSLIMKPHYAFVSKINSIIYDHSTAPAQYFDTYEYKQLYTKYMNEICLIYSYRDTKNAI